MRLECQSTWEKLRGTVMRLVEVFQEWWKRTFLRRLPPELAALDFDLDNIEYERRSAIPCDINDYTSLPDRYIPVFFDLQGRTHTTIDRFLWWLAREITRVLKQDRNLNLPMPKSEDFTQDPDYLEGKFLPDLQPLLADRNLLLTFDEFDSLEEAEIKEALARPLIEFLRRLTGFEGLNFIFSIGSSGRKLENMRAAYTAFFKTALYKEISFLGQENTSALITQPAIGILEYDRKAVDRIYQITSGHPYFTQLICHELFSRYQRSGASQIAEENVEAVLDDVVERGTVNLKFVWDEASDHEKWILASLAPPPRKPTSVGVGVGVGVSVAVGSGVSVGVGVGVSLGAGSGVSVGVGVSVAVGSGVPVGVAVGATPATTVTASQPGIVQWSSSPLQYCAPS